MTSTVEVIFQAQREIVSQITFPAEIGLMGIVVLEILGIRKSERLNAEGNARAQVLLAHKDGRGIGGGIEALLILQVIETGRQTQAGESLKRIRCVEGAGERTIGAGYDAGCAGTDDKLRGLRAVGDVGDKGEAQQRMAVEQSVRSTENALAIVARVPG